MTEEVELDLLETARELLPESRDVIEVVRIMNEQCPDCGSNDHHFGTRCGKYVPSVKQESPYP